MTKQISGVLPILQTPFDENDGIDCATLRREIDWAFETGVDGVCMAMVSELLRLTTEERIQMTRLLPEMTDGRGVVVASIGAESTRQAVSFGQVAMAAGCDAVMAIPPVTTGLPDDALWEYFATIADRIDLPLIVQDASSYVGRPMSIAFCQRLLKAYGPGKILFKPEADPVGPNLSALRDATDRQARIFDGSGGILLVDNFRRGIVGTMPGIDLLDGIVAIWRAMREDREADAYRVSFPVCSLVALQLQAGLDGFLAIEKYILARRGLFPSQRRRQPCSWSLDPETTAEIDRLLEHYSTALGDSSSLSRFPVQL